MTEDTGVRTTQNDAMKKMLSFQMVYMMISLLMIFVVTNPTFRNIIGGGLNSVFLPTFGFDYNFPLLTLIISGVIIGLLTSIPRYFFTDWIEMGRIQNRMKAFNQAYRDAYRTNQKDKIQKLGKMRMDMTVQQQQVSMNTMKPLMVLTIFTFLIFIWLYVFIAALPYKNIALPWNLDINVAVAHVWIIPYWIVVYAPVSLVVGYFATMIMKYIDFSFKLRKYEREEFQQ